MRDIVFVSPGDRGACFHLQFLRPEGEVADFDRGLVCGGRHRHPNEHGCNAGNAVRNEFRFAHGLALQRCVDDGEALLVLPEHDAGDAEHAAQLVIGHFHRSGRRRRTRRRLRKGRRASGMEGDVTLDLLHDLMDVAVEHSHRAESFEIAEGASATFRAPAPIRINGP